ncbi:protein mono-ADP-ribosyltransferase PARP12 [Latimeria chalumnae]|uniref:protein mono-ADP-ribosyltransferase PARP12 n=1 Tax=Latimeria chalumnae TaxID=7897 RepID=UPI0003C191F2|nr:PREDICTED: poly [ADP-ribose] polymerase 12 [Latimeria chalumnae]|eukprot:XP_005988721.1 PREDICTED: poly [ADP-ribose] polymerase 12 [Latimeria chalumnae]
MARIGDLAIKVLCSNQGALDSTELRRQIQHDLRESLPEQPFLRLLEADKAGRFALVRSDGEKPRGASAEAPSRLVVAATNLRLCKEYPRGECCGRCDQLHLCRYYLCGSCRFTGGRNPCKNSHSIHSQQNLPVLRDHNLQDLDEVGLRQLLLQNDPSLLPEVCQHYNKGNGHFGSCTFKKSCTKLHICQHFIQGNCRFGTQCKRSHDFLQPGTQEPLEGRGLSMGVIHNLLHTYRNIYYIRNYVYLPPEIDDCRPRSRQLSESSDSSVEVDQICLFHIRKNCGFKDKCIRDHFHLPYRWQVFDGTVWKDLPNMEEIEKAYSNPQNSLSVNFPVIDFQKMSCPSYVKTRRLSTVSSVTKPPHFILTTEWIWYWKDELGKWNEYGKSDEGHNPSSVTTAELEEAYQQNENAVKQFVAGRHQYELSFQGMFQRNLVYETKREVRRRPKFVSAQDVKNQIEGKGEAGKAGTPGLRSIPDHWDKSAVPDLGYKLVQLSASLEEYKKVQTFFQRTMPNVSIQNISRIQNLALWEVYQWQKEQMKKRSGGKEVSEKQLFHGTDRNLIDAICQHNFDWRICGAHGTAYGKGSYFARDASYSHNYARSGSSSRVMFVARVLVGQSTQGKSSFLRPPSKDGNGNLFYDSCVDNESNPSIFVIFEKHQIYPEYLIEYKGKEVPSGTSGVKAVSKNTTVPASASSSSSSSSLFDLLRYFNSRN